MAPGPTRPGPPRGRGQTTLDFLIAIGVFLTTVGFVTIFATDAVGPFADGQAGAIIVERTADELTGRALAGPPGTGVLNGTCTLAFFNSSVSDAGCPFRSSDPLNERVGIDDRWDLNVTVERNDPAAGRGVLCADTGGDPQSCSEGGTRLAAGDPPDFGSDAIDTTVRVVTLGGRDVAVVVRLW